MTCSKHVMGHTAISFMIFLIEVEQNETCQEILRARMRDSCLPSCRIFPDVTSFVPDDESGEAEAMTAGWPCQDLASDL